MQLKKALWSEGLIRAPQSSPDPQQPSTDTAIAELIDCLNNQRLYREVTLALRSALRDASAEFSFLRVRGLRSLLNFLQSIARSDSTIRLFSDTQSIPHLQVIPVLFQHSLREADEEASFDWENIFTVVPVKITSPSTDPEVALALRVLEGCCLLHKDSTLLAHKCMAVQVLMNLLATRGALEQGACLDALISIMLDSSPNQIDFETCNGIEEVADLIKDRQVDESLRLKCGEFLLLLIGHVNGRERAPMASVHDDVRRLLGEKSASLIWAASQSGSTLDPEQRLTALQIQARRVIESVDLY
uniref:Impaired sucrose induction 1-like protein n=1 Tax=Kalanchoe fedtschenkoi TaxID=63787 RepID=A0A7N0RDA2_KALFE